MRFLKWFSARICSWVELNKTWTSGLDSENHFVPKVHFCTEYRQYFNSFKVPEQVLLLVVKYFLGSYFYLNIELLLPPLFKFRLRFNMYYFHFVFQTQTCSFANRNVQFYFYFSGPSFLMFVSIRQHNWLLLILLSCRLIFSVNFSWLNKVIITTLDSGKLCWTLVCSSDNW